MIHPSQHSNLKTLCFRSIGTFVCILGLFPLEVFYSIMFIFSINFIFRVLLVSIPVQICIALFCFITHFVFFIQEFMLRHTLMHSGAKEKSFQTEHLQCPSLTAACWLLRVYWNELFSIFGALNFSLSEPTCSRGTVWFRQSSTFWQETLSREFSAFLRLSVHRHMCVCVVLQGRTPQGLGAHGHGPGQQWELWSRPCWWFPTAPAPALLMLAGWWHSSKSQRRENNDFASSIR